MDFEKWGQEYLDEALKIKKHILPIKEMLKHVSGEEATLLYRRTAILDQMYLECLHTGLCLKGRGDMHAKDKTAEL